MVGEEQGHYPFGEPWYETSPETTRIFTTYEREAGGSLDYAMFRWMGPEAGRFLSADPVPGSMGDGQSWNRYSYALNDPVNRWDPWGLIQTSPYVEVHEVWSNSPGGISWTASFDLFGWKFLFPDWQTAPGHTFGFSGRGGTGRDGRTKPPPCPPGSNIVDLASDPFASDPNVQALMWNYAQIGDAAGKEYGFLYRSSSGKNELLVGPIGSVAGPSGQPLVTYPTVPGANVAAHTHDWSRLGGQKSALDWSEIDRRFNSVQNAATTLYVFTADGILRATGGSSTTDCLVGAWPPP